MGPPSPASTASPAPWAQASRASREELLDSLPFGDRAPAYEVDELDEDLEALTSTWEDRDWFVYHLANAPVEVLRALASGELEVTRARWEAEMRQMPQSVQAAAHALANGRPADVSDPSTARRVRRMSELAWLVQSATLLWEVASSVPEAAHLVSGAPTEHEWNVGKTVAGSFSSYEADLLICTPQRLRRPPRRCQVRARAPRPRPRRTGASSTSSGSDPGDPDPEPEPDAAHEGGAAC